MLEIIKLNAAKRPEAGKGPSSRLRRTGQIPAVAYGKDLAATHLAVSPKGILEVLNSAHGQNSVVELQLEGGGTLTVMVRDFDYHPISRELLHADFVQVKLDQPVDVEVPFRTTGKPKGVVLGGILTQTFRKLPVRCLPEQIPAFIEADVSDVDLGGSFKVSQLALPAGVKVRFPDDQTIATVTAPEKGGEEGGAPGAPGAPAAGAAAPAAAAAKPAAGAAAAKPAAAKPAEKKK